MPPTRRRNGGRGPDDSDGGGPRRKGRRGGEDAHDRGPEVFLLVFSHGNINPQPPQDREDIPPAVPVTRQRGRVRYDLRRGRGDTGGTR